MKNKLIENFNKVWKDNPHWAEMYNNYKPVGMVKEKKLDFDKNDCLDLLKEAYNFVNMVPRRSYGSTQYKDSYELASAIGKYLKQIEK